MLRRHSKKIAALALSFALAATAAGAPAVFAEADPVNTAAVTAMAETTSGSQSTAINTFTWSGDTVNPAGSGTGYEISAGTVTITASGIYTLTGTGNGNVAVQADGVTLITDGLELTSSAANTIESTASDTVIQVKGDSTLNSSWTSEDGEVGVICAYGQSLSITGTGTLTINATGEDGQGIHADYSLNIGTEGSIEGPAVNINSEDEAIEALTLNLYSGTGTLTTGDDGINSDNDADESQTCNLNILGGSWIINASSDGLDSNGNITVSGGTTVVYGSTENDNSALDFDGQLSFTGGVLIGIGMNGMAQTPTVGNYVQFSNVSGISGGSTLEIKNAEGTTIYTAEAVKVADDVVLATNDLTDGDTYTLYVNGTEAAASTAASSGNTGVPGQPGGNGQQPPQHGNQPGENGQQPPDWDGGQPPQKRDISFTDVESSDYFAEPVYWAAVSGITTGTSETTFSPSVTTTRAQIVTFLWRMAGSPEPSSTTSDYTDVDPDAYYYNAVLWAEEQGITRGTSETAFSPDEECVRSQIVTFLYRYAESPEVENASTFTDVNADAYYADAVAWAAANAITSGTTETTFSPDDSCTRGQAVTFLYNYAKLSGKAGPGMTPPSGDRPEPPSGENGEVPSGNPPELPSGEASQAPPSDSADGSAAGE